MISEKMPQQLKKLELTKKAKGNAVWLRQISSSPFHHDIAQSVGPKDFTQSERQEDIVSDRRPERNFAA